MDELLLKLIRKHIHSVDTIKAQNLDSLDFHDVHILSIVSLVKESIQIGTDFEINQAINSKEL